MSTDEERGQNKVRKHHCDEQILQPNTAEASILIVDFIERKAMVHTYRSMKGADSNYLCLWQQT